MDIAKLMFELHHSTCTSSRITERQQDVYRQLHQQDIAEDLTISKRRYSEEFDCNLRTKYDKQIMSCADDKCGEHPLDLSMRTKTHKAFSTRGSKTSPQTTNNLSEDMTLISQYPVESNNISLCTSNNQQRQQQRPLDLRCMPKIERDSSNLNDADFWTLLSIRCQRQLSDWRSRQTQIAQGMSKEEQIIHTTRESPRETQTTRESSEVIDLSVSPETFSPSEISSPPHLKRLDAETCLPTSISGRDDKILSEKFTFGFSSELRRSEYGLLNYEQGDSICTQDWPSRQHVDMSIVSQQCTPPNQQKAKLYNCYMCCRSYKQARDYRAHVATHRNGSVFKCDICSTVMSKAADYLEHLKEHRQKDLHSCTYCGRYFRDSCTLSTHLRTHTGEKPYQCELCGKKFRQSGTYRRHKKVHS